MLPVTGSFAVPEGSWGAFGNKENFESLIDDVENKLFALPDETWVYPGRTRRLRSLIERRQIDNGSSQTAELRSLNGFWKVRLVGFPNHRDQDVLDAFRELGAIAPTLVSYSDGRSVREDLLPLA